MQSRSKHHSERRRKHHHGGSSSHHVPTYAAPRSCEGLFHAMPPKALMSLVDFKCHNQVTYFTEINFTTSNCTSCVYVGLPDTRHYRMHFDSLFIPYDDYQLDVDFHLPKTGSRATLTSMLPTLMAHEFACIKHRICCVLDELRLSNANTAQHKHGHSHGRKPQVSRHHSHEGKRSASHSDCKTADRGFERCKSDSSAEFRDRHGGRHSHGDLYDAHAMRDFGPISISHIVFCYLASRRQIGALIHFSAHKTKDESAIDCDLMQPKVDESEYKSKRPFHLDFSCITATGGIRIDKLRSPEHGGGGGAPHCQRKHHSQTAPNSQYSDVRLLASAYGGFVDENTNIEAVNQLFDALQCSFRDVYFVDDKAFRTWVCGACNYKNKIPSAFCQDFKFMKMKARNVQHIEIEKTVSFSDEVIVEDFPALSIDTDVCEKCNQKHVMECTPHAYLLSQNLSMGECNKRWFPYVDLLPPPARVCLPPAMRNSAAATATQRPMDARKTVASDGRKSAAAHLGYEGAIYHQHSYFEEYNPKPTDSGKVHLTREICRVDDVCDEKMNDEDLVQMGRRKRSDDSGSGVFAHSTRGASPRKRSAETMPEPMEAFSIMTHDEYTEKSKAALSAQRVADELAASKVEKQSYDWADLSYLSTLWQLYGHEIGTAVGQLHDDRCSLPFNAGDLREFAALLSRLQRIIAVVNPRKNALSDAHQKELSSIRTEMHRLLTTTKLPQLLALSGELSTKAHFHRDSGSERHGPDHNCVGCKPWSFYLNILVDVVNGKPIRYEDETFGFAFAPLKCVFEGFCQMVDLRSHKKWQCSSCGQTLPHTMRECLCQNSHSYVGGSKKPVLKDSLMVIKELADANNVSIGFHFPDASVKSDSLFRCEIRFGDDLKETGSGSTKKKAQRSAAEKALKVLGREGHKQEIKLLERFGRVTSRIEREQFKEVVPLDYLLTADLDSLPMTLETSDEMPDVLHVPSRVTEISHGSEPSVLGCLSLDASSRFGMGFGVRHDFVNHKLYGFRGTKSLLVKSKKSYGIDESYALGTAVSGERDLRTSASKRHKADSSTKKRKKRSSNKPKSDECIGDAVFGSSRSRSLKKVKKRKKKKRKKRSAATVATVVPMAADLNEEFSALLIARTKFPEENDSLRGNFEMCAKPKTSATTLRASASELRDAMYDKHATSCSSDSSSTGHGSAKRLRSSQVPSISKAKMKKKKKKKSRTKIGGAKKSAFFYSSSASSLSSASTTTSMAMESLFCHNCGNEHRPRSSFDLSHGVWQCASCLSQTESDTRKGPATPPSSSEEETGGFKATGACSPLPSELWRIASAAGGHSLAVSQAPPGYVPHDSGATHNPMFGGMCAMPTEMIAPTRWSSAAALSSVSATQHVVYAMGGQFEVHRGFHGETRKKPKT